MQGRKRVGSRSLWGSCRSALMAALWLLIAALAFSCSESEEPLWWEEGSRGGLGAVLDTIETSDVFVADSSYHYLASTGASSYLMVGKIDRSEPTGDVIARTYLRWDISELPEGNVVRAYLTLIYRGLDQADTTASTKFKLEMHKLEPGDSLWTEANLGIEVTPVIGDMIGVVEEFDLAAAPDTSDYVFVETFMHVDLAQLVRLWDLDSENNQGVVLQMHSSSTPRGFLRFISSEGTPDLTDESAFKVILSVEVDPGGDELNVTKSFEAVEDAYLITVANEEPAQLFRYNPFDEETTLLLSSGYIKRVVLIPDLETYFAADSVLFPAGTAIHQAQLILTVAEDSEWFLPVVDEFTIQVYESDSIWTQGDPLPDWEPVGITSKTFTGEDEEVVLDIRTMVQEVIEGTNRSLIVRATTETGVFKSMLFHGRLASPELRPRIRLVISHPGDGRMDPWSE